MGIAHHDQGPAADVRALASQVHPVFMLPPVATSLFGGLLGTSFSLPVAAVHATAVFLAVYTAHVKDGYVDFHVRDEDDDHPLTAGGCRVALWGAAAGFATCLFALWVLSGPGAALVAAPMWAIGFLHAPQMDTHPVGATMGYPLGVGLCVLGGNYAQPGPVTAPALGVAGVFVVLLAGVKVIDDATDHDYDRSIEKRTVAVVLGPARARRLAYALVAAGLLLAVALVFGGTFPPSALGAVLAFAGVATLTRDAGPELATMLLVRGAYVFLALLAAAVWYHPLT
jgi:1,4-dihydroxy-2-naphthoate octaprenyltransferase